jgi:hypothetical protein
MGTLAATMAISGTGVFIEVHNTERNMCPSVTRLATFQEANNTVSLFGECFEVMVSDGTFIIRHPKWSLVGMGENPGDAFHSLLGQAKEIAPFYVSESDESLSPDAIELKHYLQEHFS